MLCSSVAMYQLMLMIFIVEHHQLKSHLCWRCYDLYWWWQENDASVFRVRRREHEISCWNLTAFCSKIRFTNAHCALHSQTGTQCQSSELNHNHNISIFKNTPPVYKNTIQNLKNPPIIHVNVNVVLLLKYFLLQTYEKLQICSMHCILCITMQVCIMQESKLLQNSAFVLFDSVSDSCTYIVFMQLTMILQMSLLQEQIAKIYFPSI